MVNIQRLHTTQPLVQVKTGLLSAPVDSLSSPVKSLANPQAFKIKTPKHQQAIPLPEVNSILDKIEAMPSAHMKETAARLPKMANLANLLTKWAANPMMRMTTPEMVGTLMKSQNAQGCRYMSEIRDADEIERSGILRDCRALELRHIGAPDSQYDRTVADDAILVMRDFGKMDAKQIEQLKKKAYEHPEVQQDITKSIAMGYYGSEQHKMYGALIEATTGGIISAEEAMAMNPSGGIPGSGVNEVPILSSFDAVNRHAMRHDATGFLYTRFGVGPGYGGSPLPLDKDNPMAGQIYGLAREVFSEDSEFPSHAHVKAPVPLPKQSVTV